MNNPTDFTSVVTNTANVAGTQIYHAFDTMLPVLLPVLAGLFAIRFILGRIGF